MQLEPIVFYKYSDMLTVYKWIREHLNNWLTVVRTDYIRKLPPIDELFAMEELASELHRLITILGRKLDNQVTVAAQPINHHAVPYISIMEKIMEMRPNG